MAQQFISTGVQYRCAQVVFRIEQQQIIALLAQADSKRTLLLIRSPHSGL